MGEAAKDEFARFKVKAAGSLAEGEVLALLGKTEQDDPLDNEIEMVGRQAAGEELSRLRNADTKLIKLIAAVEEAAHKAANEMFFKLKGSDKATENLVLSGDASISIGAD